MYKPIQQFIKFSHQVTRRFIKDGCSTRAASLSFATLFAIVPLFTVSFSVLSFFPIFQEFADKIQTFVINNFIAESAEIVQTHLADFVKQTSKLSGIGLLFLLATAVLMVFNMEQAFNAIWRVEKQRSFISAFLMYAGVLAVAPLLIGTGILISTYLISLPYISTAAKMLALKKILLVITPYFSTLVAFTLLYLAVPNRKIKFKDAFLGGFVAMALFELAKQTFVLYITYFSVYRLLYGALAALPIFLVWIYVCWLITLFGAVVSSVLEDWDKKRHH